MKLPLFILLALVVAIGAYFAWNFKTTGRLTSPSSQSAASRPKPLDQYTFENLSKTKFNPSPITFGAVLEDNQNFTSQVFFFEVGERKVSGLANFPKTPGTYPVIIQLRGFIPPETYQTGAGTSRSGQAFAKNGFITLAPDFLGFGASSDGAENSIEDRLLTYVTVLTLLESIPSLNSALLAQRSPALPDEVGLTVNGQPQADASRIGLWGHSNGGQIALTVLEITAKPYPTVLWAPVSKPFPYSILYYTDDFDDRGKALRKVLAEFEKDYDVEKYSLTNFYEKINAPLQLHQGTQDEAVPQKWSDNLAAQLKALAKEVTYFTYPGDDHNFARGSWNTVVARNIVFYNQKLGK